MHALIVTTCRAIGYPVAVFWVSYLMAWVGSLLLAFR